MNCSNCGYEEASPDAKACTNCGTDLEDATAWTDADSAEVDDFQGVVVSLQSQVNRLQLQVDRQTQRIYALENAPQTVPALVTPPSEIVDRSDIPAQTLGETAPTAHFNPDATVSVPPQGERWEWLLGGNWLARIGILALIIGAGFFLKLAFDNEWIGETGRVILGLVVGVALLGAAEFWVHKYPAWARAVAGGGIAILYLSIFAGFALYDLIPVATALGLSGLVTLAAIGLALRYEARAVALLGILGGFATPLFMADMLTGQWALALPFFVLVLDLGVLALAAFRNWRWFTLLALLGSYLLFGIWYEEVDPSPLLALFGITVISLIFVGGVTLFHLLWRRALGFLDQGLIVLNGMIYFGISYLLLSDEYRAWMGGFTLLLALFHGLLGYAILIRNREKVQVSFPTLGLGLVFLITAVPVQFDGPWVSIAWSVQAVVVVWLSLFQGMHKLRWVGNAIFALILFRLVVFGFTNAIGWTTSYLGDNNSYWPVLNWHFLEYAAVVAAMYLSSYFLRRDKYFYPTLLAVANGLSLFALSVEIFDTVDRGFFDISPDIAGNVISLSLSALWTLYAATLIVLGVVRRNLGLRLAGLGLLAVPIVKLFVYDAFSLGQAFRVIVFVGLGVLLVIGGFMYQRYGRAVRGVLFE